MPGLDEALQGQTAFITGTEDVCGAAKSVKNFQKEFKKPEVKGGLLDGDLLDEAQIKALADLPPRESSPRNLAWGHQSACIDAGSGINEPGAAIARVLWPSMMAIIKIPAGE